MTRPTIIEALTDGALFGALPAFHDLSSWRRWLAFLCALYGLPFADLAVVGISQTEALSIWQQHTGRLTYNPPHGGYPEAVVIVGRQAGKDTIGGVIQGYEAAFPLVPASAGVELFSVSIAQDSRSSLRTAHRYARTPFAHVPLLVELVQAERQDSLELSTGITLASYPCRPEAVRGIRMVCAVCSELAFFRNSEGHPTDREMLRAIRPALATTGGKLLILSSPNVSEGALYALDTRHFSKEDSSTLVWRGTAPEMNPTLPLDYLQRMEADDPEAFRTEVLGEFRTGVTTFFDPAALDACIADGIRERARELRHRYFAFADPASGSGKDGFTIAVAHLDGDRAVLDALRVWLPPFNPSGAIAEAADVVMAYGLHELTGDAYAPGFVAEGFRANGVTYRTSPRDRSALYLEMLPAVNAGRVVLLDLPDLLRELRGLERKRGSSGRDRIDHRPGSHDDRANAAAGALGLALSAVARTRTGMFDMWSGEPISS